MSWNTELLLNKMKLLNNDPIVIESCEMRRYTSFCAKCGHAGESETESVVEIVQPESAEPGEVRDQAIPPAWERPGPGIALEMSCAIEELFPEREQAGNGSETDTFADLEASEIEGFIFIGRKRG